MHTKDSEDSDPTRQRRSIALFAVAAIVAVLGAEVLTRVVVAPRTGEANVTKDVQVERQIGFIGDQTSAGVEIVVAGTSMAGVGIDPQVLTNQTGMTAFNAALGCANPLVVADWLPNFVAPELKPSTAVLAVAPTDLDPLSCPRSWTPIELLTVPAGNDRSLRESLNPRPFLRENSALWRHRPWLKQINNLPFLVFDQEWQWDVTFRPDGFWQVDDWAMVDQENFLLEPHRTQIVIDPDRTSAIEMTITALQAQGIRLVVAELPMAQRWIDHLDGSLVSYADSQDALRKLTERSGAQYLQSPDVHRENSRFIDEGHMTPKAARIYSSWLADQLIDP